MQENLENLHKLWAVNSIVAAAHNKYTELCANTASVSASEVLDVMQLVVDATEKILHMRWTNADGLNHGSRIYRDLIKTWPVWYREVRRIPDLVPMENFADEPTSEQ